MYNNFSLKMTHYLEVLWYLITIHAKHLGYVEEKTVLKF